MTVGLVNAQYVEIKSGLREGEQVIYDGYESLRDGDPVVPTEWGPEGPLTLPPATGEEMAAAGTVYTCLMHPEVRLNHPGNCPKCGMKLVPVKQAVGSRPSAAGKGGGVPAPTAGSPQPAAPSGAMPAGTHAVGGPGMGGSR